MPSTHSRRPDRHEEPCDTCGVETLHEVSLEIRNETDHTDHEAKFAREPYRVTTCQACGVRTVRRVNDANRN